MKFSRLRLHGFKSFSDETVLVMEPGLTGIVGPNGCGKSNLVEAMRWVMGESSYKAMRASGMDDVIFSGSGGRPARNSAEVTLVLDNADRSAPAALNIADVLEVTRRIEREAGSVYRVNGREVRARDVQLLFADASTGAHSPAMVRQGQIGELIAARPTARRSLLEEAAGISGLHSRRHEAEIRLRAAGTNLERVDDVVAQLQTQSEALKRQARLAIRYRALSGDIRRAEATLFHLRWVATRVAEKENEAEQAILIRQLGDATHQEHVAQRHAEKAEAALAPLREREAVTGAVLQRYTILGEQLSEETQRIEQRRADFEQRLQQITSDAERERALVAESEGTLSALVAERESLTVDQAALKTQIEQAGLQAEAARSAAAKADMALREASDALSLARAQRLQAERSLADAEARQTRVAAELHKVETQISQVTATLDTDEKVAARRTALHAAKADATNTEASALAAEERARATQVQLDAVRPRLAELDALVARLEAEARTIAGMLDTHAGRWPSIVDQLDVTPGYETALGAALGDDLEAPAEEDAPLSWSAILDGGDDPALPQGAEPLSRHVSGSAHLRRRLDQIGLVDAIDGPGLMRALRTGQRLVTLEGALWRWDGFVAAADAPSPAAQRLAQRNRLAELEEEQVRAKGERNSWRRNVDELAQALEQSRLAEQERREALRRAQRAVSAAQEELGKAERAAGDLITRRTALAEARKRLVSDLAEADTSLAQAREFVADRREELELAARVGACQSDLASLRQQSEQAQRVFTTTEAAAQVQLSRIEQLTSDTTAWHRRRDGALAQLSILGERSAEVETQLEGLAGVPQDFDDRRRQLDEQIEMARVDHRTARQRLDAAESASREAQRELKARGDKLNAVRLELTRIEERLKASIAQRQQIERQTLETLRIPANRTLEASGIGAAQALPSEAMVEQRLGRLKGERERLGGVNLTAEKEAEEVEQKLGTMIADRDDIIEAIAKLRGGIAQLNREGRARLNEAFGQVNAYFQELFTTLFEGGTAELSFVESDDPLEAGLEITARPPGKKPQTMSLLSGGEQALTAMSLIFAVFLTNPAPICVLDEVDAPLDDANVDRFCNLLDSMRQRTQTRFMVITHNPITMARMDRLFGVTMAERGVSQLVSVDLTTAERFREAG